MAERKMADALQELYNDGVKAKMKDFIIENIDTIVEKLAGKYLTQTDAQTTYLTNSTASSTYLTKTDASNTYLGKTTAATSSSFGAVKVGSNITNSSGTISLTKANVTSALGYTPPTSAGTSVTLASGTGSSTTDGMTQKAITDALNNIATLSNGLLHKEYNGYVLDIGILSNGHFNIEQYQSNNISGNYKALYTDNDGWHMIYKLNSSTRIEYHFKADGLYGPNGKIG